jgi:hypothetical protein
MQVSSPTVSDSPFPRIWEILLDKGIFAGLVLLGGYWLNRNLERFRAREGLRAEFLRERTKRLDELYALMIDLDETSTEVITHSHARKKVLPMTGRGPTEGETALARLRELGDELLRRAERAKPWVDVEVVDYCVKYHKALLLKRTSGDPDVKEFNLHAKQLRTLVMEAVREGTPQVKRGAWPG